jgi:hypothetical protein
LKELHSVIEIQAATEKRWKTGRVSVDNRDGIDLPGMRLRKASQVKKLPARSGQGKKRWIRNRLLFY